MAYIPSECSLEEYERVIYSGDAKHRLYVKHGNTVIGTDGDNNASPFASQLILKKRILKNGSKTFSLNNFVSQEAELVLHDYIIDDLDEDIEIKIGTYIDSVMGYVYVPVGIFKIQDNPTTDKNKITYKLRDFSVKFDYYYNAKEIIDANGGPVTKLQILRDICQKSGVTCAVFDFIGSNDFVSIYDNSTSARVYVSYIAEQAGCLAYISRDGKLKFIELNSILENEKNIPQEIIESFVSGDSFKVSKVIYESGTFKYEAGSGEYDTLYINQGNPYISNQTQINNIYNKVNLFEINSFKTGKVLGNPTHDPYDLIKVEYEGKTYKTLAQYTLTFAGTMTSKYETTIEHDAKKSNINSSGNTVIKNYVKSEIDNSTATIMNEVGKIEGETNQKIAKVTQTVEELNSKISDIADVTTSAEDTDAKIEINEVNQSEPIRLVVRPIEENISYLYPSDNLYPSDDLFMKTRTIRFHNKTTNEDFDYELPDDLLYYDEENYDEFILDYDGQSCVVNKRVGYNADGTTYVLDNPTTVPYTYPTGKNAIILTEGDYDVYILGYNQGYIFARLMAKNIYTTQFYTKAEVDSEISQTANSITSEVNQKLTNYSTTTEMNNKITQEITNTENVINLELNKKVNNSEYNSAQILLKINGDTSSTVIRADKVDLDGVATFTNNKLANAGSTVINGSNITTGTISADRLDSKVITTDNFSAQNINADNITSGTLSADKINGGTIKASSISLKGVSLGTSTSKIAGMTIEDGTISNSRMSLNTSQGILNIFNSAGGSMILSNAVRLCATAGVGIFSNSTGNLSAPSKNIDLKACNKAEVYLGCMETVDALNELSSVNCKNSQLVLKSAGTIYANGSAIGGSSSKNTKTNIKELSQEKKNELYELIKDIPLFEYDYKPKYGKEINYGFLIEDIENTKLNDLLHIVKVNEDIKTYCSEDLTRLNLIMIKELIKKVEKLENKIKELESDDNEEN